MTNEPHYAPLIQTLVAFFAEVDRRHREDAMDPEQRARIHQALDLMLDGKVKFRLPDPEDD